MAGVQPVRRRSDNRQAARPDERRAGNLRRGPTPEKTGMDDPPGQKPRREMMLYRNHFSRQRELETMHIKLTGDGRLSPSPGGEGWGEGELYLKYQKVFTQREKL